MILNQINYVELNARQKENYNFQKVPAILADYGFSTVRLTDDWQGADFVAQNMLNNEFLKIQLKTRIIIAKKYERKDLWICFKIKHGKAYDEWYLVKHDALMDLVLTKYKPDSEKGVKNSKSWNKEKGGAYSWPRPRKELWSLINDELELIKLQPC
jgi:hypothetical protein